MQITSASKSSIETAQSCEWLYYLQYICGIRTPSGKSALLGNIVHHVLEMMARQKKNNRHSNDSKRNNYLFLLDICFNHYAAKNPEIEFSEADKKICAKHIKVVLDGKYHPFKNKIIGIEHGFELELNSKEFAYAYKDIKTGESKEGNFKLRGFIDLIIEHDKDTIEIVDYKTGKYISDWSTGKDKDIEDFHKDLQLRIYYLACRKAFPQYKNIKLTVYYLYFNKTFTVRMDGQEEIIIENLRREFLKIKNNNNPTRLKDDSSRSSQHFKCRYVCYFGKVLDEESGKPLCQHYREIYNNNGYHGGTKKIIELTVNNKQINNNNVYNDIISRIRMFDNGD